MSNKKMKKLALGTALCLFANMFSFVTGLTALADDTAEDLAEMPIIASYNFDDGELPASFSSYTFRVEDGKLRTFGKWSKFSFSDIPKNSSLEFKIKPVENRILPAFRVKLRDDAEFWYKDSSLISEDTKSEFTLISASDNQQKGDAFSSDTTLLEHGSEYTLKYAVEGNSYSVYLNGEQIISAEYEPASGELKSGMEFALMPEDNTVGVIGFYLDDVVVRGKASALDIPAGALYAFNFEDGNLPNGFSASDYSIEDGKLKISGATCNFSFLGMAKEGSLEFRIQPIENLAIPDFGVQIGNGSFSFVSNYVKNSSWDDCFRLYNATTWGNAVKDHWITDAIFTEKQRGHKVRYVSEDDVYKLYVDDQELISGECPVETEKEDGYDMTFRMNAKQDFIDIGIGFYIDDIVVKGKLAGSDIAADVLYEYNFDDGVLPDAISATAFSIENGKLRTSSINNSFSVSGVPKNSYVEFKISPVSGNVIPGFTSSFGNSTFNYVANFVQNSSWDDRLTMSNATTGIQVADKWATDSFLAMGDNVLKYFTDGNTYSLYVNNKKVVSGECRMTKPTGTYTLTFRGGKAGVLNNIDFYIDDITVKTLKEEAFIEESTEGQIARILTDTWKTETGSDGVSYAGFDVELNVPEGEAVNSFWITLGNKNSKLIKINPVEGEKIEIIPVVMKYTGAVTAKDVKIYVK